MVMNFEDLHEIEGLQFIPVNAQKQPIVKDWQNSVKKYDLSNCVAVGLVCGKPSGNVEVIDIDQKYSLDGKLFENYKRLIHELDDSLLQKLVVQKTKNGGYHFIYRCSAIGGNTKLANRSTIDAEKDETYQKTYESEVSKGKDDSEARRVAEKSKINDKIRVLIETRGIGGQIVCNPSVGYEMIYGDLYGINDITPDERDILFGIARQFNEVMEEYALPAKSSAIKKTKGLSAFDDYNKRGDVIGLLQNHGWKVVKRQGPKTIFLRPGQTSSVSSGNFDENRNWFTVFTTSSEFEPEKAYLPYAVFAILECNKDFVEASRKLYDMGYGDKDEPKKETTSTRVITSRVDVNDNDFSFLAKPQDYDDYLQSVRDGTLKMGLTTGSPSLDKHFLFKEGNLVMTNGIDNTGKSVFTWYLCLLAAMYHGWNGIIFSSENTLGAFMRKMIQFYWGKPLVGPNAMNETEYNIAKAFVEKHFSMIKAQEDLFNYKDIINMVKKASKVKKYHYGMIDPYNSLKIDLSGFSKLNTHEYHYEALSEIKAFGQQNNFGWFVNHHAVTAAARTKDGEKKYQTAPNKADTEGGQKVANKADDFLTIHRITQHPTDWMVTELHVRKIKDTETGGRPTSLDFPVKFEMYRGGCAFIERLEEGGQPIDPVHSWHIKRESVQSKIIIEDKPKESSTVWKPYKDNNITF
jgi:hypothetical protein